MTNAVIIAILIIILFVALKSTIGHFQKKSGCCGSGTYKARPRKLSSVAAKSVFTVEGMSCQHCVNRVMEAVHSLKGTSAVVNLKKGIVTISMETPMDTSLIKAAIEKAGYTVTDIH